MRKAILNQSFSWICESCGAQHFVHPVVHNATKEEKAAIMELMQIEGAEDIELYRHPSIVVCPLCRESFETELDQEEMFDDTPEQD